MSLKKTKNTIRTIVTRPLMMRLIEPAALAVCIGVFAFSFQPSKTQTTIQPQYASQSKAKVHHAAPKKKTKHKPKPAATKPASETPGPAAAPTTQPAATAGSSKVEPVVKPSPRSKVSGLAPTSPAPSGGSGSGGGSTQVTTGYTSLNWSGYLAASATFTSVYGSWTATNATGNGTSTSADSTWIGIGGVTSGDLIQVGTQNIITASGQRYTSAFYEMLPAASINITSLTVHAGDSMSASVVRTSGSLWAISITDNTTGKSFSISVSYASSLSSAEWIEEDPSYAGGSLVPFDNFHEADFSGVQAVMNGVTVNLNTSTAQPVIMVNNSGTYIAVPSTISGGGTSFTVTP